MKVLVKSGISWGIPRATTHCIYFLWFSQCTVTCLKALRNPATKNPFPFAFNTQDFSNFFGHGNFVYV